MHSSVNIEQGIAMARRKAPWHCWILDLDMGKGSIGLDLLRRIVNFPFVIVLSGLRSMTLASDCIREGALSVFDKDPESIGLLCDHVCKVSALGYLLNGNKTQYFPTYKLLMGNEISTPQQWADRACLTLRQLFRICRLHPVRSPRHSICLYRTLYYLTAHLPDAAGQSPQDLLSVHDATPIEEYRTCIDYVTRKNRGEIIEDEIQDAG